MTTSTNEQDRLIAELSAADLDLRELKATIEKRIRAEMQRELEAQIIKRDVLAYHAKQVGAFVKRIAQEGLHTKATITAYRAIENGERYVTPAKSADDAAPVTKEFAWTSKRGQFRAIPHDNDILPLLPLIGVDLEVYRKAPSMHSAVFTYHPDEERVTAVTSAFDPATGRHPVVALAMGENPDYRNRMAAWARANVAVDATAAAA